MFERRDIKEQEIRFLAGEFKKHPELFAPSRFIEDKQALEKFGIYIPGKEDCPKGYLKLWPQDFIVEEIASNDETQTVYRQDLGLLQGDALQGATIYVMLVKAGLSTIEAVQDMTRLLKCDPTAIQFGGIKDKDAITGQRISIRGIPWSQIQDVSSPYFFLKNGSVGKGVVQTGDLKGNTFTILVRIPDALDSDWLTERIERVGRDGFYNFFYLQRFGTPRLINYYWGICILVGNYKEAVHSFLTTVTERESPYFQKIREAIRDEFGRWGSICDILKPFPLAFQNEFKIASYLENHPDDYVGALRAIPEQITLWVFAVSSLLFNKRISQYLNDNREVPDRIPLFLSRDPEDWRQYEPFLKEFHLFPPDFNNLRPFPNILLRKRFIQTKARADIHKMRILKEGVALTFSLSKGMYATTFLAHLFNLISGKPPETIDDTPIDIKAELGEPPLAETIAYFNGILHAKTENLLEKLTQSE
ncbi:MAG: tRNA pseudouridine(13) synthase TruD [Patescibacteria group bacterium]